MIQSERVFKEFSRSFTFPDIEDDAQIEAKFKNGVLELTIPKGKSSQTRNIEIKD